MKDGPLRNYNENKDQRLQCQIELVAQLQIAIEDSFDSRKAA